MPPSSPFLLLAPELIQAISDELSRPDLKRLRLTCKQLAPQVTAHIFRNLVIDININNFDKSVDMLQSLANGNPVVEDTRELVLLSVSPAYDPTRNRPVYKYIGGKWTHKPEPEIPAEVQLATNLVEGYLPDALRSFKSLTTLRWSPLRTDSAQVQTAVVKTLATLPALKNLHLDVTSWKAPLPLDNLQALQEISIFGRCPTEYHQEIMDRVARLIARSPELSALSVDNHCDYGKPLGKPQSLHQLLDQYPLSEPPLRLRRLSLQAALVRLDHITIPHLRTLTSLDLTAVQDPFTQQYSVRHYRHESDGPETLEAHKRFGSPIEDIWKSLSHAGVHLKELRIDNVSNSLLNYLSSYSGLKNLDIMPSNFDDGIPSDAMAAQFFSKPLGNHVQTLEKLTIIPPFEGKWCFNSFNSSLISQCTKLKSFHVCLISYELPSFKDTGEDDLESSGNDGAEYGAESSILHDLINVAAEFMPLLDMLTVSPANLESLREAMCGNPAMSHFAYTRSKMAENAVRYQAPLSVKRLPTLSIGSKIFREDAIRGVLGLRYLDDDPTRVHYYEDW